MKSIITFSKLLFLSVFFLFLQSNLHAQKARDVLEDGRIIKDKENIYLKFEDSSIYYSFDQDPTTFHPLSDSVIFLIKGNGTNVFLQPMNPVNFSYKNEITFITDPINAEAIDKLSAITDFAKLFNDSSSSGGSTTSSQVDCLEELNDRVEDIKKSLSDNQKDSIVSVFKSLQALSFLKAEETKNELAQIEKRVSRIGNHFNMVNDSIKKLNAAINAYTKCIGINAIDPTIVKFVYSAISKELRDISTEQYKRFTALQSAYKMTSGVVNDVNKKDKGWWISLGEVNPDKDKIELFTITISGSGFTLSDSNEIVTKVNKVLCKRTIRGRNFQLLVPEVSTGIAYTWITFPNYSTVSDSSGKMFVASAGNEVVRRINFTAMVNFTFCFPKSPVLPFWQIGIGSNAGYPTLLSGIGFRLNLDKFRFATSIGYASTWTKTLGSLKIGDPVSGQAELEKDLHYEFNWPLRPYVGLQFNF